MIALTVDPVLQMRPPALPLQRFALRGGTRADAVYTLLNRQSSPA